MACAADMCELTMTIGLLKAFCTSVCSQNELRNELFWVLTRPIHIVATSDDYGQLVRGVVGFCHEFCSSLGC